MKDENNDVIMTKIDFKAKMYAMNGWQKER